MKEGETVGRAFSDNKEACIGRVETEMNAEQADILALEDIFGREPIKINLFPDVLECIRSGDTRELACRMQGAEFTEYFQKVLSNRYYTAWSIPAVFGSCILLAYEGGVSPDYAAAICARYQKRPYGIQQPDRMFDCLKEAFMEFAEAVNRMQPYAHRSLLLRRCMEYIDFHICSRISLEGLAAYCGYSLSRMQHLIREETGQTLHVLIRQQKIEKAKYYLKYSDESCLSISQKLAFCSQSNFIRQFRTETGTTPAQYRRNNRQNPC